MTQAWLLLNNGHCCNFKCNYGDWKKEENNSTVCSVYGMVEVISVMFVWLVQCSSIAMVLHTRLCMASITTMACQRAGASKSNYVYIITVHWEPMAYNTCPHWHTGTHTGTHTHTHNTLTHRQTHWHTHTLIHRQTDTLTHTHTHTHINQLTYWRDGSNGGDTSRSGGWRTRITRPRGTSGRHMTSITLLLLVRNNSLYKKFVWMHRYIVNCISQ